MNDLIQSNVQYDWDQEVVLQSLLLRVNGWMLSVTCVLHGMVKLMNSIRLGSRNYSHSY